MTEKERTSIIANINQIIDEKNETLRKKDQLFAQITELEKEEHVREYLQLKAQLKHLISILSYDYFNPAKNKIIKSEFKKYFFEHHEECQHPLFLYVGSFSQDNNPTTSEQVANFSFNRYACIQCNQVVTTENYQEFETNHLVLKSYTLQPKPYLNLYFELLYYHNEDEALQLLIKRFNEDNQPYLFTLKPPE